MPFFIEPIQWLNLKAAQNSSANMAHMTSSTASLTASKDCNTSSLPPLPYSFVRLEKSKLSSSSSAIKNASNSNLASTCSLRQPATRLIIPLGQTKNLSASNDEFDSMYANCKLTTNTPQHTYSPIVMHESPHKTTHSQLKMLCRSNSSCVASSAAVVAKKLSEQTAPQTLNGKMSKSNDSNQEWDQVKKRLLFN